MDKLFYRHISNKIVEYTLKYKQLEKKYNQLNREHNYLKNEQN